MRVPRLALILLVLPALVAAQTSPAPGALFDVGGHRLHLWCVGPVNARPTVILEAGGGASSATWAQVQLLLVPRVRTCAYDRAGMGWSEPGPLPRTWRQQVFELHQLLRAARIPGPFVFVGHSIGGLLIRNYQCEYPAEVAGMVLVDPAHESQVLYYVSLSRWARIRELATGKPVPEPRSGGADASAGPTVDYDPEEFQLTYLARLKNPVPLGDLPLIVLGAGRRPTPPGTAESLYASIRIERDSLVRDLAGLSRNSRFVLDPTSEHGIQNDDPVLVARSIEAVLRAVTRKARVAVP